MCKEHGECQDHIRELESKLSMAEAEANYWHDLYENEVIKSRQKDAMILERFPGLRIPMSDTIH